MNRETKEEKNDRKKNENGRIEKEDKKGRKTKRNERK